MLTNTPSDLINTVGDASDWSNEDTLDMKLNKDDPQSALNFWRPFQPLFSHIVPVMDLAKESGVVLPTLPSHTSQKMQPLDRTVFEPY